MLPLSAAHSSAPWETLAPASFAVRGRMLPLSAARSSAPSEVSVPVGVCRRMLPLSAACSSALPAMSVSGSFAVRGRMLPLSAARSSAPSEVSVPVGVCRRMLPLSAACSSAEPARAGSNEGAFTVAEILAVIEHDRGVASETSFQSLGFARALRDAGLGASVTAVVIGAEADALAETLGAYGATTVLQIHHSELSDYAPEAWGDVLNSLIDQRSPIAVVAAGTDRGNEVLAHVAAVADLPFACNVTEIREAGAAHVDLTRVRWGGSLLEQSKVISSVYVFSSALHAFSGDPSAGDVDTVATPEVVDVELGDTAARTRIVDRVTLAAGITLTTAQVVVSGGRGVGSADGFTVLEELAGLLGGAVGCSRVVTNNGWRPHSDQVGQTGKRIAPELYIACGISGAIQHWVGMMASRHVLAINTDGEANMVGKAEYAVVGDLHKILPAVIEEIHKRRS
jgi:electron transfer flavoprotein alpha subunit